MNTQLLKRLYSIYSPSGKEQGMMNFLSAYIRTLPGNISLTQDRYGNLYAVKGESDTYPCLISHTDQVAHCNHSKDFRAVETRDIIFGLSPGKKRFENLGADDKNGIFICLECRKRLLNYILCIRFFIEVHSIVSASRFFHMPTYLRVVIECQSRFFPFFPAFSRNCPDYFLHTSGSSSFRSLSDLGAR